MSQNESLNVFIRFVEEKHNEVKTNITELFTVLLREDKKLKLNVCEKNIVSANNLLMSLAQSDSPTWLNQIVLWCKWFVENQRETDCNNILFAIFIINSF